MAYSIHPYKSKQFLILQFELFHNFDLLLFSVSPCRKKGHNALPVKALISELLICTNLLYLVIDKPIFVNFEHFLYSYLSYEHFYIDEFTYLCVFELLHVT